LDSADYSTKDDGSAAIFTIIQCDEQTNKYKLLNGNVGDSRTVLARKEGDKYVAIACTFDHKPTDEAERARIEAAGGTVQLSRVDGQLALSRAFGDRMLKQPMSNPPEKRKVSSYPDWIEQEATPDDFLFMACDGIYESDIFSRESAVDWIAERLKHTNDLAMVCADLLEECLTRGSRDNMSAMIIQFKNGTDYHKDQIEYRPGPWFDEESDQKFQEAYIADAKCAGYTIDQAHQLRKDLLSAADVPAGVLGAGTTNASPN
jgi:serine/threonine protein phosphatase PrpC